MNSANNLGDGTTTDSSVPVATSGGALAGKTATVVSAGAFHSCVVTTDGEGACWGLSKFGRSLLGDGTLNDSSVPVAVLKVGALAGKTLTSIAAGYLHTCALASDGSVACWGADGYGQLGDGANSDTTAPVAASGGALSGKTVTAISAGFSHTCALTSEGRVACWGDNTYGEIGDGSTTNRNTPVAVTGGALTGQTVVGISAGYQDTCAVTARGGVACWGHNTYGQLGVGTTDDSSIPLAVAGSLFGQRATSVSIASDQACAVTSTGGLTCWGRNNYGQLGDGTTSDSTVPVDATSGVLSGHVVTSVTVSGRSTCVTFTSGRAACWGYNGFGELGDGSTTTRNIPVLVSVLGVSIPAQTLSVTKSGNGKGSVKSTPSGLVCGATCSPGFAYYTSVVLTATPTVGTRFVGWSGAGCAGTGSCTVLMTAARSVTATFTLKKYQLTVTKKGAGRGTVKSLPSGLSCGATCKKSFDYGKKVTLTATPARGSKFVGWSGSGCKGTGKCKVTVSQARGVTATFAKS